MEDHTLRALENKVLREIFGPKISEWWRESIARIFIAYSFVTYH
jgi:hypothetical protein